MQIIPGLPVLWREVDQIQIGYDPRTGVILSGLAPHELEFVDSLSRPQSDLELAHRARQLHLSQPRVRDIVAMLDKAQVITTSQVGSPDVASSLRVRGHAPQYRSTAHVRFARGDYVSVVAALILADAGVGIITCRDNASVQETDHPQMAESYTGIPRHLALTHVLRARGMMNDEVIPPTVAVETGPYVINPVNGNHWLSAGIPVVHACIEEVDVVVGPTTIPHESACASCMYLHYADADPFWNRLAMQAFGRTDVLADIASMELAGAPIAREVLALIDRLSPSLTNRIVRIGPTPATPQLFEVPPHLSCGCSAAGSD